MYRLEQANSRRANPRKQQAGGFTSKYQLQAQEAAECHAQKLIFGAVDVKED
jgi:hypothetical protein